MKTIYKDLLQGTEEWYRLRRGMMTASEMKLILSPIKLQYSQSEKERAHLYELAGQRITNYVEPRFEGADMIRGHEDEPTMRALYNDNIAPVEKVGFITNSKWGFTLGYSPDGLVTDPRDGSKGAIEGKSRLQKYMVETVALVKPDTDHILQLQTGMLVAELDWIDYCVINLLPTTAPEEAQTMPMAILRVYPDPVIQQAILGAAGVFEEKLKKLVETYHTNLSSSSLRFVPTQRKLVITGVDDITGSEEE